MKIASFNVNGIRAINKSGKLKEWLDTEDPDIVCLQEIRCDPKHVETEILAKYPQYPHVTFSCSEVKKGYAGVAVMSKIPFKQDLTEVVLVRELESGEGRLCLCVFDDFVLMNSYTPNSRGDATPRHTYRTTTWDMAFLTLIKALKNSVNKKIIVCGDLNVAHTPNDIYNADKAKHAAGYTIEERRNFVKLLDECGLVDCWRDQHPDVVQYTWWSNFYNARSRNMGWRIDYILASKEMWKRIGAKADVVIRDEIKGSDHCPVCMSW